MIDDIASKNDTHDSHILINSRQRRILNPKPSQPQHHIEPIKRQRRKNPRRRINRMITHRHEKTHITHNMEHPKPLITHPPHDPQRTQHKHTQEGESSDAGGFLLGTEDLEIVFEVVADPEGAVDGGADEEPATGPAVDVVEFLVAVAWEEE